MYRPPKCAVTSAGNAKTTRCKIAQSSSVPAVLSFKHRCLLVDVSETASVAPAVHSPASSMDCLVAVPSCCDRNGLPSAAALQALAAHMPPACVVGSPALRSSMFLPRLHSIPETDAEHSSLADVLDDDVAFAAAAAASACKPGSTLISTLSAQLQASDSSSRAEDCMVCSSEHATCSSQHGPCSCCSSQEAACSTPDASTTAADNAAAQDVILPAVVADTWAISIRHFTDCVPITADSVCGSGTCHTRSARCSAETGAAQPAATAGSSPRQQQQQRMQANCQAGASSAPRSSSSSSSLMPAAEDDSSAYSAPLSGSLSLSDMDALEWQPWDRVAKWLELHPEAAAAAAGGSVTSAKERPSSNRSGRGVPQQPLSATEVPSSSLLQQQQEQLDAQQQQEDEPLFDAPDWWQESVKARLEEQREAFQSSWWCRLKISMGLAAQRASA